MRLQKLFNLRFLGSDILNYRPLKARIKIDNTDLSANYSMLDNIEALPDCKLVKALYEFGLAAEAYKAYLEG